MKDINRMTASTGRMVKEDGGFGNIVDLLESIANTLGGASIGVKKGDFDKMIQRGMVKGHIFKSGDILEFSSGAEQHFVIQTGENPIFVLKALWKGSVANWNFEIWENPILEINEGIKTSVNGFNLNRASDVISTTNTYRGISNIIYDGATQIDNATTDGESWDSTPSHASANAPYCVFAPNSTYLIKIICGGADYLERTGELYINYLEESMEEALSLFD